MTVTLTWQTIITAGAVVGALIALTAHFAKVVRWVDHQKEQDSELHALQKKHDTEMKEMRESVTHDLTGIVSEQALLTYGILACLKGLKEQGCNGPVTEAINKIERHLNQKAHE